MYTYGCIYFPSSQCSNKSTSVFCLTDVCVSAVLCVYPLCYSTVLCLQLLLSPLFICVNDGRKKENSYKLPVTDSNSSSTCVVEKKERKRKHEKSEMEIKVGQISAGLSCSVLWLCHWVKSPDQYPFFQIHTSFNSPPFNRSIQVRCNPKSDVLLKLCLCMCEEKGKDTQRGNNNVNAVDRSLSQ